MTKVKLLATASIAALTLTFATAAYAEENNFGTGNAGDTYVKVKNNNDGGRAGDSGNVSGVGTGGSGAGGSALGGAATSTINANSGNKYTSVKSSNKQRNESGGGGYGPKPAFNESVQLLGGHSGSGATIDTSGGTNKQYGGNASSEAKSSTRADNTTKVYAEGGNGESGNVEAENETNRKSTGSSLATGDNGGTQANNGPQASGAGNGGGGGSGNIASANTTGGAVGSNTTSGGGTSGVQNANGGAVSGGVMGFAAMSSAAGAFGFNMSTGNLVQRNAANAIAADVGTINNFTVVTTPGG